VSWHGGIELRLRRAERVLRLFGVPARDVLCTPDTGSMAVRWDLRTDSGVRATVAETDFGVGIPTVFHLDGLWPTSPCNTDPRAD